MPSPAVAVRTPAAAVLARLQASVDVDCMNEVSVHQHIRKGLKRIHPLEPL